uniref:Uncharacterized protein n=1 Tax=Anas zonorhyncha TaxID=75864 RepID=A0A8B9U002_9AVES
MANCGRCDDKYAFSFVYISSYFSSEQRNIQKNVNVDLYLSARSQVDISHRWPEVAAFGVTPSQAAGQGWVCTTPLSPGQREPSLIQTNLSCPSQLFQDTTSQFSRSPVQQQNNLCFRLQQHSSQYVAHRIPRLALSVYPAVKVPPRHSHLEAFCAEEGWYENINFPQQHQQKAKAAGTCSAPTAHQHCLEGRNENGDYPAEKQQPRAVSCIDPGSPSLVNKHLSLHAGDTPLRHKLELCPSSGSSGGSVNACRSSALTLGDLRLPNLESFQVFLQLSRISAGLYRSVWRLKQKIALMGIRGSLPLEPSSSPGSGSLYFAPDDSASSTLSTGEQLAGVKNGAAQARLKWGIPFAKGCSLDAVARDLSHAEPLSVSHGYGYVDSSMWRSKLSGDVWPERLSAGVGSARLVDTKADSSKNCSPHFRCQSQAKSTVDENGGLYVHTKIRSSGKVLKEETTGGAFACPIPWKKDLPASMYPEGLQLSLETCFEGAQMNVGVAMYGTPREVCLRVASPSGDQEFRPIQQLSIRPAEVNNCEPPVESSKALEEVCDSTSQADRRMIVADSSHSSPFSVQDEKGFGEYSDTECGNVSREGRRDQCSYQSSWRNWEADANLDCSEDPSVVRSVKEAECCEEGSQAQEIASREVSDNSCCSLKVHKQSFQHLHDRQIVTRCFQAWRDHVLWKRAAARQLYRRRLLQKGLGAFQWAVHQRRMQLKVAQQRHASALLAASFHKWNEAVAQRGKKQAPQPAPYSYTQCSSAGFFGLGRLATMTTSAQHQLTAAYLQEAEQACRVESELWTQLHRRQGDEFCWRAQAIRDMRRLAAFRLWRLQKELLSREEARLLEVRALLEKKRLRNIFQLWRSQCLEIKKILQLTTCIQRNLISRCFSVWKETVEQKAFYRCNLVHLRVESLRKYFQQWVQMLQIRESNKQVMVNFLLRRWRQHYGPAVSSVADETATERRCDSQPWWTAGRWFPEKTGCSLDDLCLKVKLQRVYLLWKARLYEHHRADSFTQALEQYRLRKALKVWHQKFLMLNTTEPSPKHSHGTVCEEPLALLFCEDLSTLSTSSGFHSSATATLASQSSLEKEYSSSDSSQQSCSSIVTAEDVPCVPCYSSSLQLYQHVELPAELDGELYLQASFPSQNSGCR